jgi:hypothetical protein
VKVNAASRLQSQQFGGVLAIAGALDSAQKPVLLASHNEDHVVRLWELPTFAERGELSAVSPLQPDAMEPRRCLRENVSCPHPYTLLLLQVDCSSAAEQATLPNAGA